MDSIFEMKFKSVDTDLPSVNHNICWLQVMHFEGHIISF